MPFLSPPLHFAELIPSRALPLGADVPNAAPMQCRIQVLGAPSISTSRGQLSPAKSVVFAAALYLGLNRGRAVRRAELAALLWPDAADAARGERLRWLVHQLKAHGLVPSTRAADLLLPADQVVVDVDALARAASAEDVLSLVAGDVLSGFDPRISDGVDRWLEETRDAIRSNVVRRLGTWIAASRRSADWSTVEELARRTLALDQFHEEASLALAEALAVQGRLDAAIQSLARFQAAGVGELAASVKRLRSRLREIAPAGQAAAPRPTLLGRGDVFAQLLDGLDPEHPRSSRYAVSGPAGIGKSRLLDEFALVAHIRGAQVARVRCARADALRPLSLAVDLARALLQVRGALGASPASVAVLRRFVGDDLTPADEKPHEMRRAEVYAALSDLVGAVTDDGPLAVAIDDAHWAEPSSWSILSPLFAHTSSSPICWVVTIRAETPDAAAAVSRVAFPPDDAESEQARHTLWLAPLERADVAALCTARAAGHLIPPDVLSALLRRAAGIPFIAEALVDHWVAAGDVSGLPPSVARLVRARLDWLPPAAERVLAAVAVLGPDAGAPAVEAVSMLDRSTLFDATRALESAGILRTADGVLSTHALWTEGVLHRAQPSARQLMHRTAAEWLERVPTTFDAVEQRRLWAVATHWLDANDPSRARQALDRAASLLTTNGFVAEAAAMLERAAEIAGVSEAALHYWSRAAELWMIDQSLVGDSAVQRVHASYDRVGIALDPESFSPHHDLEILAWLATSRGQIANAELVRRLLPCVTATSAAAGHRLAAATRVMARSLLGTGDLTVTESAWNAVRSIVPANEADRLELEFCMIQYHMRIANDPVTAIVHAERALALARSAQDVAPLKFQRAITGAAWCYELAGDLDRAQSLRREMMEFARRRRTHSLLLEALTDFVGSELEAGRLASVRALLPILGRGEATSVKEIERGRAIAWATYALEEGDAAKARQLFNAPLSAADAPLDPMPRARILAIYAHIALLEDDDATIRALLPRLLDCFVPNMNFMDHPAHVTAMCLERLEGEQAAAAFVRRFLAEHRCERWTPRPELVRLAELPASATAEPSAPSSTPPSRRDSPASAPAMPSSRPHPPPPTHYSTG